MQLASDTVWPYTAENGAPGKCRVRIYLPESPEDSPVVVISQHPENEGQSITNAMEVIAGSILERFDFSAYPLPLFVEHYPPEADHVREPESFDLVSFSDYEFRYKRLWGSSKEWWITLIGEPDWEPSSREEVEALVGEALVDNTASHSRLHDKRARRPSPPHDTTEPHNWRLRRDQP